MSLPPEVQAAFEADIATLTRVIDPPLPPLAWGRDLSCVTDCTDSFAETPPNSPRIIAEAATRRLITPRGTLLDDPNYGLDLRGYCNRGVTLTDLRTLQARVRAEIGKDARVAQCEAQVTSVGTSLSVQIEITPADPNTAPFPFVISVTGDGALLTLIGV
jgi:hypothetical protein